MTRAHKRANARRRRAGFGGKVSRCGECGLLYSSGKLEAHRRSSGHRKRKH